MKKGKLRFILSMTIFLSLLLFRPIDFDQGHESIHKNLVPPKPGTYTEGNFVDGSQKKTEVTVTQDGVRSNLSPQLSLSQDEIDEINDGKAEKVLVIPVSFTDEQFDDGVIEGDEVHDKAHFEGIMEQMKIYYEMNSGYVENISGITLDYYVSDFISLDTSMSTYGADSLVGIDDANGDVYELARYAVLALDTINPSFDFSEYDTDGDNVIDHIIIIHAGIGQEESGTSTDIWSHQWYIKQGQVVDGVYAHNYTTMPENGKLGVFAHEFGHDLGLPDLYDTNGAEDGQSEGAGVWDLMANGSWNGGGASPSNLSAWSRAYLGWEVPNIISSNQSGNSLENTNGISSIIKVFPKGNLLHKEHYLIEYRRKIGNYDSALPGEGVLIWHIDDYMLNDYLIDGLLDSNDVNTIANFPGVVFEHADGIRKYGGSGDPFPGSSNNYNFTYMPYGLNLDNIYEYTYVDILDINTNGDSATFDIYVEENAPIKPTIDAPVQGDITTAMPTFTWNIVPQAQEYIIQVATDSVFGTVVFEISLNDIQADVNGRYSYTLDEIQGETLEDGVPLYWRITATNAANTGDTSKYVWSDVYQFNIPLKLNTPINLSATEPTILDELEITWDSVNEANNYLLEVDGQIINQYGTNTTYNHTNLDPSSTHTYRVMAVSDNNVSSWSAPYVTTTQDEATISLDCSRVVEGNEDGSEIIVDISSHDGEFISNLTLNDVLISGLPQGVTISSLSLNGTTTSATITLSGNSSDDDDYDEDQLVTVSIENEKFVPQQNQTITTSAYISAINEPKPDEPTAITFSIFGTDANILVGTDTTMEFSIDGGNTYIVVTPNDIELTPQQLSSLSVENDILVRYKKILRIPASDNMVIDLLPSSISADFSTAVVEGSEDGSEIIIELQDDNGKFVNGLTVNDISISGLPQGITKNNITINSTTSVSISLSGNSTVDYDVDQEIIVSLTKDKFMPQQTSALTDSAIITATVEPTPVPPTPAPAPPLPVPEPIVEGVEIPLSVIGESSSEEQIIVRISSEDEPIVFTEDLLNQVSKVKKDIVIEKEGLSLALPPGAIDSDLFEDVDAVFTLEMDQIPPKDVQDKLDQAEQNDGKGLFAINGLVFEFEAQVVTEDTSTPVTEFEKDVTITISLDSTSISDDDLDKLGIYWFNEATEEWEYMGGQYDPDTNTITFTTGHFSTYSIFRFEKSFVDIQNHWAISEIEQLASMRIIKGKSDDIFDPNATITRAEFTALIVRTLGLSKDDYTVETPFEDVINDKWYYMEIGIAYNAGLLPKKYSNAYDPNTPISREDMAIIMSNALQLKNGFITMNDTDIQSILEGYTDVDGLDSEAIKAVAIAVNEGLIQGRTLSTIVPEGNLMRAEAAVVIKRVLGII